MNPRATFENQRHAAEILPVYPAGLGFSQRFVRVDYGDGVTSPGASLPYRNHTLFPLGQQGATIALLPSFSGAHCPIGAVASGGKTHKSAPDTEPRAMFRVACVDTSRQGTEKCPSNPSSSPAPFAPLLPPAATRLSNRGLSAQPSARGPQRSPAAACCKAQPLVQRATSLFASLIPANADPLTNRTFTAQPARRTRNNRPAQHLLWRGFRVYLKTQKDTPCSRKS